MSREIKFRAWQEDTMLYQVSSGVYGTRRYFSTLYEDCKLMQYTGLKDKNGKEIYEGDILKEISELSPKDHQNRIGTIVYEPNVTSFMVLNDGGYCHLNEGKWDKNQLEYTEIIGNIHENPELLK